MALETLKLTEVTIDDSIQPRAEQNTEQNNGIVNEFCEDMKRGDIFPPVEAVFDEKKWWLYDGWKRMAALKKLKKKEVRVKITKGNRQKAVELAAQANRTHGCRRTNADKRRAVEILLANEWAEKSDRAIAEHCGVSNHLVAEVRQVGILPPASEICQQTGGAQNQSTAEVAAKIGRDGRRHPGRKPKTPRPSKAPSLPTDGEGKPIPEALREVFESAVIFEELCRDIQSVKRRLEELCETPLATFLHRQPVEIDLENAKKAIRAAKPHAPCPYCGGKKKCKACHGQGWLPKQQWHTAQRSAK